MKKQIFAMFIFFTIILSGCGASKEKMMKEAIQISPGVLASERYKNEAKFDEERMNKTYVLTMPVYTIESNYATFLFSSKSVQTQAKVFLPKDVLVTLNRDEMVTFVGKLTDIEVAKEQVAEYAFDYTYYTFKSAHIVNDSFEVTGEFSNWKRTDKEGRSYVLIENIKTDDALINAEKITVFLSKEDTAKIESGDVITVSGKLRTNSLATDTLVADYYMYDAVLK